MSAFLKGYFLQALNTLCAYELKLEFATLGQAAALLANNRLGWKSLPETNTLNGITEKVARRKFLL